MIKYSQNFLVNARIADYIVNSIELTKDDIILEIGPGRGILTERLVSKYKVIAVEIDEELCEFLSEKFAKEISAKNLVLLCGDASKINFPKFTKVVANIPYHISSPLIFKILDYEFKEAVIMVQREFAERMVAKQGSKKYGRLSVMIYYHGHAELLRIVKRGNFRPIPKVDSAIVKIIKDPRFCADRKLLERIVRKLFEQRRKKIKNVLGNVKYGDMRVESLTPEQICEVAKDAKNRVFN